MEESTSPSPNQLMRYMRSTHNLLISPRVAQRAVDVVMVTPPIELNQTLEISFRGRNLITGFPTTVTLLHAELRKALSLAQE